MAESIEINCFDQIFCLFFRFKIFTFVHFIQESQLLAVNQIHQLDYHWRLGSEKNWKWWHTYSTFFSLIQVLTDHLWISADAFPWCNDTNSLPSRCFECWNQTYLDLDVQVSSINVAHLNSWTSANGINKMLLDEWTKAFVKRSNEFCILFWCYKIQSVESCSKLSDDQTK